MRTGQQRPARRFGRSCVRDTSRPRAMRCAFLATVLIFAVTQEAFAYRTAADLPGNEGATTITWDGPVLLHLDLSAFRSSERSGVRSAVLRAANRWNEVGCADVELTFAGASDGVEAGDGLNTVAWVNDWVERGYEADAMATTDSEFEVAGANWRIVEADILLNHRAFRWSTNLDDVDDRRSIEVVVTHELGHLLGLAHSCDDVGAPSCAASDLWSTTMNPSYGGAAQASLEVDDVAGLCSIYPRDTSCTSDAACRGDETCLDGRCQDLCVGVVCADGAACIEGSCEPLCSDCAPCTADSDCGASRHCSANRCVVSFADGETCDRSAQCRTSSCVDGRCGDATPSEMGLFGDTCTQGIECSSELCAFEEGDVGFCSRMCDATNACPPTFECADFEEGTACVPSASGCGVGADRPPFFLSVAFGFFFLFQRRNR
jgi:hypothetical protein